MCCLIQAHFLSAHKGYTGLALIVLAIAVVKVASAEVKEPRAPEGFLVAYAAQYRFTVDSDTVKLVAACLMDALFAIRHLFTTLALALTGRPMLSFPRCVLPVASNVALARARPDDVRIIDAGTFHISYLRKYSNNQFPHTFTDGT